MIRYECVKCGALLESSSSLAGQRDKCPLCGQVCIVPVGGDSRKPLLLGVIGGGVALAVVAVLLAVLWDPSSSEPPADDDRSPVSGRQAEGTDKLDEGNRPSAGKATSNPDDGSSLTRPALRPVSELMSIIEDDPRATWAAEQLGAHGAGAREAVPLLGRLLATVPRGHKGTYAMALGQIGDPSAVPILQSVLPTVSGSNIAAIRIALLLLGNEPDDQVRYVTKMLNDAGIRRSVDFTHILADIREAGPKGAVFLPVLRNITGSYCEYSLRATLACLGDETDRHIDWLIGELDGPSGGTAAYALSEIGPRASRAIPKMIELVRKTASDTGNIGPAVHVSEFGMLAVPGLLDLLEDTNYRVRIHAGLALWQVFSPSSALARPEDGRGILPRLERALDHETAGMTKDNLTRLIDVIRSSPQ